MRAARERRTSRRMCSIVATVGLIAGLLAITGSTAGAVTCLAQDGVASSSNLQTVIDGASTGDTIVITGTCVGKFSIPGGGSAASLTLMANRKATLDGNNSGPVVYVGRSETVAINNLVITHGLCMNGGGGIYNFFGTVNLSGKTRVNGNTCSTLGGGIYNYFGTVNLSDKAQVNGNSSSYGGGIQNSSGTVNLSGKAQVNGNSAKFYGGGVENQGGGHLTMSGRTQVNGNTAGGNAGGGGIYNENSTVTMSGKAQVNSNTVTLGHGGGIYKNGGTVSGAVAGVNVKSNIPDNIYP